MKKIFNVLLAVVLVITLAFALSSCASTCSAHSDINMDGLCDACGASFTCPGHADVNGDGMCDNCLCSFSCAIHYDTDGNEKCDICGANYICSHADADMDGKCDLCLASFTCPGHVDVNIDGYCDKCKAPYACPGHTDENLDGYCDSCKAVFVCQKHRDSDGNKKCDYCKAPFACAKHLDSNLDEKCDVCDAPFVCSGHVDNDRDGVCDKCMGNYKQIGDYRVEYEIAANATKPSLVSVALSTDFGASGKLVTEYTITYKADGSFVIEGTYQEFNISPVGEPILTKPLYIICDAEGNYTDNGEFSGNNPGAVGVNIDFSKITPDKNITSNALYAKILRRNTEAILGVDYGYDVNLTVSKNSDAGKITGVIVEYSNVKIICTYH